MAFKAKEVFAFLLEFNSIGITISALVLWIKPKAIFEVKISEAIEFALRKLI